eukprot:3313017-Amphidinium_carterae.1
MHRLHLFMTARGEMQFWWHHRRRNGCDAASHQRSWGVSELQFFADEDCSDGLPGIDQGAGISCRCVSFGFYFGDARGQ